MTYCQKVCRRHSTSQVQKTSTRLVLRQCSDSCVDVHKLCAAWWLNRCKPEAAVRKASRRSSGRQIRNRRLLNNRVCQTQKGPRSASARTAEYFTTDGICQGRHRAAWCLHVKDSAPPATVVMTVKWLMLSKHARCMHRQFGSTEENQETNVQYLHNFLRLGGPAKSPRRRRTSARSIKTDSRTCSCYNSKLHLDLGQIIWQISGWWPSQAYAYHSAQLGCDLDRL